MSNLFESAVRRPLADQMRPKTLSDVVGQNHLIGTEGPIGRMIANGRLTSTILWGPPGTGKTTIARLLAHKSDLEFVSLSAVFSGVTDLRKVFRQAKDQRSVGRGTLLFIDEIHRFNRAQQDSFLPYVENGTVVLVGATTENPSFELNSALLSRAQVLVLNRLSDEAMDTLICRAEAKQGKSLQINTDARLALIAMADGDGRYLLNMIEQVFDLPSEPVLDTIALATAVQKRMPLYDKSQDGHYNLISALHKSLRGSDADAALYWFARMLTGGEDPTYILRRLVRFASEDVGLADPQALTQSIAAWEAFDRLGSPEGELAIAQCVIYLATAPKSNAAYKGEKGAKKLAFETGSLMPPKHILNAPTKLLNVLGYGDGYAYDHDSKGGFSGQNYFPDEIQRLRLYNPDGKGFEAEIVKRLEYWAKLRRQQVCG